MLPQPLRRGLHLTIHSNIASKELQLTTAAPKCRLAQARRSVCMSPWVALAQGGSLPATGHTHAPNHWPVASATRLSDVGTEHQQLHPPQDLRMGLSSVSSRKESGWVDESGWRWREKFRHVEHTRTHTQTPTCSTTHMAARWLGSTAKRSTRNTSSHPRRGSEPAPKSGVRRTLRHATPAWFTKRPRCTPHLHELGLAHHHPQRNAP